jgi:hypothetical protein
MQTWARDAEPAGALQACFYDRRCSPMLFELDAQGAFLAPGTSVDDERERVAALLSWRAGEGISRRVSDGFVALARKRRARHPWRVLVALPLSRAWKMWTAPQNEPVLNPEWRPWPRLTDRLFPRLRSLSLVLFAAVIAAALVLLWQRRTRIAAAILVTTIAARTVVLAWSAFCLPRYLVPLAPVCFVLVGAGIGVTIAAIRARLNSGARVRSASAS